MSELHLGRHYDGCNDRQFEKETGPQIDPFLDPQENSSPTLPQAPLILLVPQAKRTTGKLKQELLDHLLAHAM